MFPAMFPASSLKLCTTNFNYSAHVRSCAQNRNGLSGDEDANEMNRMNFFPLRIVAFVSTRFE